jgi:hypothetical protein
VAGKELYPQKEYEGLCRGLHGLLPPAYRATVHNLVSLSRKKNSLPEMEEEGVWRENLIGSAPPVRFTALSPDQKGLA